MTMMSPAGDTRRQQSVRRVLVIVDDSPEAMQALEAAVALSRLHKGELKAVFVEEVDLVRSAGFAFAGEIGAFSGTLRPKVVEHVVEELRRRAHQVQKALEQATLGSGVRHELIVRRGKVVHETLALASPGDLLIVGRVGWSQRLGRRFGSVPLALARAAPGAVLIWASEATASGGHVVLLAEDQAMLQEALPLARERALARHAGLSVLLGPQAMASRRVELEGQIAAALEGTGLPFEIRELGSGNVTSLLHALGQAGAVELVLSRRGKLLSDPVGARLLERIRLPVCVVP